LSSSRRADRKADRTADPAGRQLQKLPAIRRVLITHRGLR
jgi:hypothetical protein